MDFHALMQEPYCSALHEITQNSEVEELIASVIRQQELLIDKVIELASEKGIRLQKVPAHDTIHAFAGRHGVSTSDYNLNFSEWLASKSLTMSKLTTA